MLKINHVYEYENLVWYVLSKRKHRRVIYTIKRVFLDGTLGEAKEVYFKRNSFSIVEGAKISIKVDIPKALKAQMNYLNLVKNTKNLLDEYNDASKRKKHKNYNRQISQCAYYALGHYDSKRKVTIDLRVFAKDIGLRSARKLYSLLVEYYKENSPDAKYITEIQKLSNPHLISSYQQINNTWKYIFGYSKQLDTYLERDIKGYITELKNRDINLAGI